MDTLKQRLVDWDNRYIVKGWYKTYTVWLSVAALVGPELLQVALDNFDTFVTAVPLVSDSTKSMIRIALLIAIPVVRAIKQTNLPPKDAP
jgi:hypothetical protein